MRVNLTVDGVIAISHRQRTRGHEPLLICDCDNAKMWQFAIERELAVMRSFAIKTKICAKAWIYGKT